MVDASVPKQEVDRFSVAERDQRWARVRRLMERDRLDVIVALGNSGAWDTMNANVRYLTGIGGNCSLASVIFPLDGDVTAVVGPTPGARYWLGFQDWVTDVRQPTGLFTMMSGVTQRLAELPPAARRGRVGLVGLAGLLRHPEGNVAHGAYEMIRAAVGEAELVNATALLEEARFVKSDEEIRYLERAVAIAEDGVEIITREARPGVPECVVYGRVLAGMVERGSEIPTFFSWQAGPPQQRLRNHLQPTRRKLRAADVISVELESSVLGYRGHATQSFVLGRRSARYAEMLDLFHALQQSCHEALVPGATPARILAIANEMSTGDLQCHLVIHGRGQGEDPPLLVFRPDPGPRHERLMQWQFEENAVLMVRPYVYAGDPFADSTEESIGWGDCVVVERAGARRLGKRDPGVIEIR